MGKTVRFGVSVESELLASFDRFVKKHGYPNRSKALRDLMRQALVEEAWDEDAETVGSLTLVYDHHDPGLVQKLTEIQHHYHGNTIATMHSHATQSDCIEIVMLKGRASIIKSLADKLISTKGVKHGQLVMSAVGRSLP